MSVQATSRFLDLRALAALEHLRFTTRHRIEGGFSGRHESRVQGGAGEFADYREYSEGEDLRRLDWKVLARSGRAYLRLYQDETNLVCTIAIDASGSMLFGDESGQHGRGTKLEYAQYLATGLSHVIARGQDQVGLAVFGESLGEYAPPASTRGHVARVHGLIESIQAQASAEMAIALRELFERATRRGVLVVMSDFLMEDLDSVFAALRLFRHRHWEVLLLHFIHPLEEDLPQGTAYRFEGMENEGTLDCSPADICTEYRERFGAHTAAVRSLALAGGLDYRRVSMGVHYLKTLQSFLVERAG